MKKIYLLILIVLNIDTVSAQCCSNEINLLAEYNPDFSAPFVDVPPGFITDNPYTFFPTPGTYIIVASRNYGACQSSPQYDHTTGDPVTGRFLWFDASAQASPTDPDVAWKPFNPNLPVGMQNSITVSPNTTYVFSCWIRDIARSPDCITGGAPLMGLRINGEEMAEVDLALITDPCCPQWTYLCAEWNSGNTTSALIQIESRRADGFNDLGIDDVYFGTTSETFEFSLGADTTVCEGVALILSDNIDNSINLWSNLTYGDTIQVTSPGIYWLEITKNNCKARDSITVTQDLLPSIILGADTVICNQVPLLVFPTNSGGTISNYLWQNNSTSNTFTINNSGIFWLQASNSCGISSDSMNVIYFIPPSLGGNINACNGNSITLNGGDADSYQWSNGAIEPSITITNSGVYWLQTTSDVCSGSDTIEVSFFAFPVVNLGNDTSFCQEEPITLSTDSTSALLWSNGSANASIDVSVSGIYWLEASNGPCSTRDSIVIVINTTPIIELGNDTVVCQGESITLNAGLANNYLWSDSTTSTSIVVTNPGLYRVQANNEQCIDADSILVSFSNCDCEFALEIPNSFTPNNDGFNDNFVPKKIACFANATLKIFNRWGSEIFLTDDVLMGWNGKSNNITSPDGTYFWIIDYTTNTQEQKSKAGFVTLLN